MESLKKEIRIAIAAGCAHFTCIQTYVAVVVYRMIYIYGENLFISEFVLFLKYS